MTIEKSNAPEFIVGADEIDDAVGLCAAVLRTATASDWSVPAGDLSWSCRDTAVHIGSDCIMYAAQLAGRATHRYVPFRIIVHGESVPGDWIEVPLWRHSPPICPSSKAAAARPIFPARVRAAAIASAPSDFLSPGGEMVNDAPGAHVPRLFGGTVDDRENLMRIGSPLTHVHRNAPPFLIAHGTLDETVPFQQATRLRAALEQLDIPVQFLPIQDGYHNWNPSPDSTWPKVRYLDFAYHALAFFQRSLRIG